MPMEKEKQEEPKIQELITINSTIKDRVASRLKYMETILLSIKNKSAGIRAANKTGPTSICRVRKWQGDYRCGDFLAVLFRCILPGKKRGKQPCQAAPGDRNRIGCDGKSRWQGIAG